MSLDIESARSGPNPWETLSLRQARGIVQQMDQRAMALGYPNALEAMQDLIDLHALTERLDYKAGIPAEKLECHL